MLLSAAPLMTTPITGYTFAGYIITGQTLSMHSVH
jgi:hypothetical protein